ncbi:anti-sigma factor domain-containing protein [Promicromonospora sukumoe]|uniref:anti-sigma factor domain-containing protein n=1 Tax=Promicromonospora sukumoe TaxID=88382 RepID=UPI0037C72819
MADETTGTDGLAGDVWDLLPGYALGALDDADREAVERLLASDADARRALDEYRDVVAAFVVEAEPPAALRASVLAQVQDTAQLHGPTAEAASAPAASPAAPAAPPAAPASPAGPDPEQGSVVSAAGTPPSSDGAEVVDLASRRRRRWGTAVAAVAAAFAIAVPTTVAVQVSAERDRLREQAQVVSEMLADPDSSILRGAVQGGGEASVLVAGDDMLFRADDLPALDADQAYQLWVVEGDGSVSSAGLLATHDGQATSLVQGQHGVGMAVSVEPKSGSEQPTTAPIVVLGA